MQQHGRTAATHTAAAGAEQSRTKRSATNDHGVTRSSVRLRRRGGLATSTGDGSTCGDDGVVERLTATDASSRRPRQRHLVRQRRRRRTVRCSLVSFCPRSDHQYRRRLTTRVVSFGSGHAHQSHGHKQLTESTRLSRRPHSHSTLVQLNVRTLVGRLSYISTAIVQLTGNTRVFYSVSVNFRDTRMPAGEHIITQRLRASAVNFGAERLDSGAAISRDTGTHTRRRPCKHTRTQTTQHPHTNQTKRETGVSRCGLGTQPRQGEENVSITTLNKSGEQELSSSSDGRSLPQ